MSADSALLDQYSISQTTFGEGNSVVGEFGEKLSSEAMQKTWWFCPFGAPKVALIAGGRATISQACCNHWECPCCGIQRAKQEYKRMVAGCEKLAEKHELYFWTITCRGRELSYEDAIAGYAQWTNVLLTSCRTKAKRAGMYWSYVQVTEHQKKTRAHPHSHLIATFCPRDGGSNIEELSDGGIYSQWFIHANEDAGLGAQCRLSRVVSASAVSRYVAKYMFKSSMSDIWPEHWRRVRYSRNFPKLEVKKVDLAIILLSKNDWREAGKTKVRWVCDDVRIYNIALKHLINVTLATHA